MCVCVLYEGDVVVCVLLLQDLLQSCACVSVLSSRNILPKYGAEGAEGGGAGRSGSDGRVCHRRYAQIQEPELWKGPAAVVGAL